MDEDGLGDIQRRMAAVGSDLQQLRRSSHRALRQMRTEELLVGGIDSALELLARVVEAVERHHPEPFRRSTLHQCGLLADHLRRLNPSPPADRADLAITVRIVAARLIRLVPPTVRVALRIDASMPCRADDAVLEPLVTRIVEVGLETLRENGSLVLETTRVGATTLLRVNVWPAEPAQPPVTATMAGLRRRAEAAGLQLHVGPHPKGWMIVVRQMS